MAQIRSILVASMSFTFAAVVLCGVAVAGIWWHLSPSVLGDDRSGAVMTFVSAVVCWLFWWQARRDRDKALLVRTLGDVAAELAALQRRPAQTRPLPRAL